MALVPAAASRPQPWSRTIGLALLAIAPVALAGFMANLVTLPNIPVWHAGLAKPWFNPPNWLFAPVWTVLYLAMAGAFFRILRLPASPARTMAIIAFLVQLALNASWSWAFFGWHSPLAGLCVIVPMLAAIIGAAVLFHRLDRPAGWSFAPYVAWVGFATVLNAAIYALNG